MSKNSRKDINPSDFRRKRQAVDKHHKPHAEKFVSAGDQKNYSFLIACIVIAVLAMIPFSLGKYFEFNSPDPFDSGAYVYSARHILDGAEIGVEEKPACRLGTLALNLLGVKLSGFNETGSKTIQTIIQLAALVMMFAAMKKLFGTLAAGVGVIVASSYLSAPFIAKYGNVKEQYMIAFMVMGMSSLVMRQLGGRWWWSLLAGGFVSWGPLFKETGTTAIGAIGLFIIAQPIFKHRTWKQTGIDILLLFAGAIIAVCPFFIWILGWNVKIALPYQFIWHILFPEKAGPGSVVGSSYISGARQLRSFSEQCPIVLRYYGLLILPVALALGSILARIVRFILSMTSKEKVSAKPCDRFVLLFAVWWILDMSFIWISPRSYEQYYLPLNASAAMLGGYFVCNLSPLLRWMSGLFSIQGRYNRGLYLWNMIAFILCWGVVITILGIYSIAFGTTGALIAFTYYHLFVNILATVIIACLAVKRLHDLNRPGWVQFIPIYNIYIGLLMLCRKGTIGPNKYGPDPLGGGSVPKAYYDTKKILRIVLWLCLFPMLFMSWHVFFGIKRSPHSGTIYTSAAGLPEKRNGYLQRYNEISERRRLDIRYPWEQVGEYIRDNSNPDDKIFVWGWFPGIYVSAQRLAPTSWPSTSEMHTKTPERLAGDIKGLLAELEANKPKYIVDSRNRHFPYNRPPLELWPVTSKGLLPNDERIIAQFDIEYAKMLRETFDDAEAGRYEAMKPFREFIRKNYDVVRPFGQHILFKLKDSAVKTESKQFPGN